MFNFNIQSKIENIGLASVHTWMVALHETIPICPNRPYGFVHPTQLTEWANLSWNVIAIGIWSWRPLIPITFRIKSHELIPTWGTNSWYNLIEYISKIFNSLKINSYWYGIYLDHYFLQLLPGKPARDIKIKAKAKETLNRQNVLLKYRKVALYLNISIRMGSFNRLHWTTGLESPMWSSTQ